MDHALEQAARAARAGEVPVGAVVVDRDGHIIARGHNMMRSIPDASAHAEINVLRTAARVLQNERLTDCDLYVTLEPCAMCAGAIALARIRRLYYGAADEKSGAVDHGVRYFSHPTCHHTPEIYGGIQEQACAQLLYDFFAMRR